MNELLTGQPESQVQLKAVITQPLLNIRQTAQQRSVNVSKAGTRSLAVNHQQKDGRRRQYNAADEKPMWTQVCVHECVFHGCVLTKINRCEERVLIAASSANHPSIIFISTTALVHTTAPSRQFWFLSSPPFSQLRFRDDSSKCWV